MSQFFAKHDRWHLLLKGHYFFFHASFGSFEPVLNLIVHSRGLSDVQILYTDMLLPFLVFLSNPAIGYFVDHSRRFRLSFNLLFALASLLFLAVYLYPSIKASHVHGEILPQHSAEYSLHLCANEEFARECAERRACGCFYQAICTPHAKFARWKRNEKEKSFRFNLSMEPHHFKERELRDASKKFQRESHCDTLYEVSIDRTLLEKHFKDRLEDGKGKSRSFASMRKWPIAACAINCSMAHVCDGYVYPNQMVYVYLYAFLILICLSFYSNSTVVSTSIGFHAIDHPNLFGRQRLWGTIGAGITAFFTSRLYKHYKKDQIYLITFGITSALTMILTNFISFRSKHQLSREKKSGTHSSRFHSIVLLLRNFDVLVFLFTTFIWGMSFAVIEPYYHLYIEELKPCQSHLVVGYMSLVTSIAEVGAFFVSHRILQSCGKRLTTVGIFLAFAIRFLGYYITERLYLILCFELLHFFTFGILFALIADEAFKLAPPHLVGTLQGLVYGISFGLGRGIGLWICLFLSRHLNKKILFLIFSLVNLTSALIYVFYALLRRKPKSPELPNEQLLERIEEKLETLLNDGVEFAST